jgi:DNA-binding winged helix-turn-helix (wHTH) protein
MLTLDDAKTEYTVPQSPGRDLRRDLGVRRRVNAEGHPANPQRRGAISFGEFCLVPTARTLTRNGSPVQLGARALDILIALLERAGQIVSKAELFAIAWPTTCVEESNLRVQLSALRKALGDGRSGTRFIVNVVGRGYTFVGEANETSEDWSI